MHTTTKQSVVETIVRTYPDDFHPEFAAWVVENLHIYQAFEEEPLKVARVRHHYSARTIIEVLRHNTAIAQHGGVFKIDGDMVPSMARLFAHLHPGYATLFSFRELKKVAA